MNTHFNLCTCCQTENSLAAALRLLMCPRACPSTPLRTQEPNAPARHSSVGNRVPRSNGRNQRARAYADISGRQYSFAGILTALELVGDHNLAGIFYFTGFGLWTATGTLSFFYLCAVYAAFRNAGGVERVQYEATQAGVQMAANNAAANARR